MAKNKFGEKKALRKRALFFVQRDAARAEHIDASFAGVVVLGKQQSVWLPSSHDDDVDDDDLLFLDVSDLSDDDDF